MLRCRMWIFCLTLAVAVVQRAAVGADAPGPDSKTALAWRIEAVASSSLGPRSPDGAWRRSAAAMELAATLSPGDSRFGRLAALARMHVHDTDQAIADLVAYRKSSSAAFADRVAQAQLIELYASRLQTADARVDYLKSLLDHQDIPADVRSHVASEATGLLAQKSAEEAAQMARRAVQLYPLPEAQRQYYALVARQQPLRDRIAGLLAVLRSNPNQPSYAAELANILAGSGMGEQSLPWYNLAITSLVGSDLHPPELHELLVDFAAELMTTGHRNPADATIDQMLGQNSMDPDAWFLKLTSGRGALGEVAYGQNLELARSALVRRYNALYQQIMSGQAATQPTEPAAAPASTQPQVVQPLDPAALLAKLKDLHDPSVDQAVVSVVADLAWFELYYDRQIEPAKLWVDLLSGMLPSDSILLQRLQGWYALLSDHPQQAQEIFAKAAGQDALAELGAIRAAQAQQQSVPDEQIEKLLRQHRTGLVAAMLVDALRGGAESATTKPATAPATLPTTQPADPQILAELDAFPKPLLGAVLDPRQLRQLYSIRAEPVQTNILFGDPVLAEVTLFNYSDYPITVGDGGLLQKDLWFEGSLLGLEQRQLGSIAADQIANVIALPPHSQSSQVVRLDQSAFHQLLQLLPYSATRISAQVVTNPIAGPDGVIPATGGQRAQFSRTMVYVGLPIMTQAGLKQITEWTASSDAAQRLRGMDVMAAYVRLAAQPNVDESLRKATVNYAQEIARLRNDPDQSVAAWASYLTVYLSTGDRQDAVVMEMLGSPNASTRLLALFAAGVLPSARQAALAAELAGRETDPAVKDAAADTAELAEQATTQPSTTQPTTQPATTRPAETF